jgi:hypothetical protein
MLCHNDGEVKASIHSKGREGTCNNSGLLTSQEIRMDVVSYSPAPFADTSYWLRELPAQCKSTLVQWNQ